jgi:hypothetical protein
MAEMNFNLKGPVGIVVAVLVIAGYISYRLFMPFWATSEDKIAIKEEIERLRTEDMNRITKTTIDQYKKTGDTRNTSKEIKQLMGDIKITDIEGKKSFMGDLKVKVKYTIGGNIPPDGGIIYFRLYRRKKEEILQGQLQKLPR